MVKGGRKLKPGSLKGPPHEPFKGKRGTGKRFQECVRRMSKRKGVRDPEALCAAIARGKFGKRGAARMAARGRRRN